ncbi:MAG: TetR family transcriptional regulator C-terminal domain-containing protein [Desulfuromonadales bacterium]|nr:TetR family transcriptional regulator C-terminal domain-containing protein [Desulfuromonadales bacterium]
MRKIHSKDMLIEAGLELVLKQGYNATGVEKVLKHAKIPKGSFYNFFSSKEEFGLAMIDAFAGKMTDVIQDSLEDNALKPLERIRKSFEQMIDIFEKNNCSGGCLIGNLSLEMADSNDVLRQRLESALQSWSDALASVILEARQDGSIPESLDAEMLAENMILSLQGALLRAKVKKSSEPLKNFIFLYFDVFLAQLKQK